MEIIFLLIIFFGGMIFGVEYTKNRIAKNIQRIAEKQEAEEEEHDPKVLPLRFETYPDTQIVYCYNRETNDFLAQADNMDDLLQRVQDRFPKMEMIAHRGELEAMVDLTLTWNPTK
jgi:hypothetical protein